MFLCYRSKHKPLNKKCKPTDVQSFNTPVKQNSVGVSIGSEKCMHAKEGLKYKSKPCFTVIQLVTHYLTGKEC